MITLLQFHGDGDSERILKIGQQLTKLCRVLGLGDYFFQVVRQRIPGRRNSDRKSPTVMCVESTARYELYTVRLADSSSQNADEAKKRRQRLHGMRWSARYRGACRSAGACVLNIVKAAITSKIKHAIKHKTSPARLAQHLLDWIGLD